MPPRSSVARDEELPVDAGASDGQVIPISGQLVRAPWSEVGPEFIQQWGYPDGKFDPEHLEILGPSGSGKTQFELTVVSERVLARDSAVVFIFTKRADKTFAQLRDAGWNFTDTWRGVVDNKQVAYWPRTRLIGRKRQEYLARKIEDLLSRLWREDANVVVCFDEIATIESLSPEVKSIVQMYWREARSLGISIVAMKQRPQGVQRDMHSEASWVVAFRPKDQEDAVRVAELMGSRKYWLPMLMSLQRERYEFVILHVRTGEAVISWLDVPVESLPRAERYRTRR